MSNIIKECGGHPHCTIEELPLEEFVARKETKIVIDLERVRMQADAVVAEAEAKASAALRTAEEKAAETIALAESRAEEFHAEGVEKGYREGSEKATTEIEAKYSALFLEEALKLKEVASIFRQSYDEMFKKSEPQLIKLALDIAKKVIRDEAAKNENIVISMVREGLTRIIAKEHIVVRVNPGQLALIEKHKQVLVNELEGVKDFELREDPKIAAGGAVIETSSGSVELRIEKQIQEIQKAVTGHEEDADVRNDA